MNEEDTLKTLPNHPRPSLGQVLKPFSFIRAGWEKWKESACKVGLFCPLQFVRKLQMKEMGKKKAAPKGPPDYYFMKGF